MQSIHDETTSKPFVKWVGGKRSLIHAILPRLPETFKTYYEPFVGGGALYFAIADKISRAVLSDINPELITTYQTIKNQPERLIHALKKHARHHSAAYYYDVRQYAPRSDIEIAARFLYLNKTCYNGLYRVNSKGVFNTPIGRQQNANIVQQDNIAACSQVLKNTKILWGDFTAISPRHGDFVYFDPPYYPVDDISFTSYSKDDFTASDQERLHDFIVALHKKGVFIMLSNSKTSFIKHLYAESFFRHHTVKAPRFINCKAHDRGEVNELLITNY
jgi:DNA adenine methylase